tara:strand:- start:405 stop:653 length:249 start_codon:yes stop_codon:yes gene_type:complete
MDTLDIVFLVLSIIGLAVMFYVHYSVPKDERSEHGLGRKVSFQNKTPEQRELYEKLERIADQRAQGLMNAGEKNGDASSPQK